MSNLPIPFSAENSSSKSIQQQKCKKETISKNIKNYYPPVSPQWECGPQMDSSGPELTSACLWGVRASYSKCRVKSNKKAKTTIINNKKF